MSPAAALQAAGAARSPLIASIDYAPGASRLVSAMIHGPERGLIAARRVAGHVMRNLGLRAADLDAEPATDNPADTACYVLDARPGRDLARLARVIGMNDDRFMDGVIAAHLGDGARRRQLFAALGEG